VVAIWRADLPAITAFWTLPAGHISSVPGRSQILFHTTEFHRLNVRFEFRSVTLTAAILAGGTGAAYAASATINITAIETNGVGNRLICSTLDDTKAGLQITPRLAGPIGGDHGLHVNPNCGARKGPNGQSAASMAAGDWYDPADTGNHLLAGDRSHRAQSGRRHT
jgi:Cu/Zn superoxide dismutase